MDVLTCSPQTMPETLGRTIFGDRKSQFVSRLKWDLCVTPDGLETDQYDDADSTYLVVHEDNTHLGSCRLRPVSTSTMLLEHFQEPFPTAAPFLSDQRCNLFELTRFCRAPHISVRQSSTMLDVLADALDDFRETTNTAGFVAVVFPQVARFLARIGVRFITLSTSRLDDAHIQLICITHAARPARAALATAARTPAMEPQAIAA